MVYQKGQKHRYHCYFVYRYTAIFNQSTDKGHLWIKWEFSLIDKYVTFKDAKAWLFVFSVFWHILKVSDTIYVGFNIF